MENEEGNTDVHVIMFFVFADGKINKIENDRKSGREEKKRSDGINRRIKKKSPHLSASYSSSSLLSLPMKNKKISQSVREKNKAGDLHDLSLREKGKLGKEEKKNTQWT